MTFPLLSCIMPTIGKRKQFVEQSIVYFNRQDYPNKELIIVVDEDNGAMVREVVPAQENIIFTSISGDRQLTLGMKHNITCSLAQGEIICHWDDDDYYGPHRLSRQIEPLLKDTADISGLRMGILLHIPEWAAYRCSDALHDEFFPDGVHTGTLLYRKTVWKLTKFPDITIGEDAKFLRAVLMQGARLAQVENKGDFIYMRHEEHNTWPLTPEYRKWNGWQHLPIEQYLSDDDLTFYRQFAASTV